jgi:hypothetical protein
MSAALQPSSDKKIELSDTQERNKRYVQIDAVGVGTAGAAAPFLPVFLTRLGATPGPGWTIDLYAWHYRINPGIMGRTFPSKTA